VSGDMGFEPDTSSPPLPSNQRREIKKAR